MKPLNPHLVLATAIVLPGVGQVLNGKPVKGLQFVFFMLLLGWITAKTASPDVSIIGRYAGGIFIYAISVLDAYRFARIRKTLSETVNHADAKP
jgi:TM2 domain-containing membrane protein YozV